MVQGHQTGGEGVGLATHTHLEHEVGPLAVEFLLAVLAADEALLLLRPHVL
mgnify:CR=1 FL=1